MKTFTKKLQSNFTIIDNRIAQSRDLSIEAKGLYFYMQSLPDDWDFSEIRIAEGIGAGLDKTKRIIKELLDFGLLERGFFNNENGHRKAKYTLYDLETLSEKRALENKPTSENPTLDYPMLENPTEENPLLENPLEANPMGGNPLNNKVINIQRTKTNKEIKNKNNGDLRKSPSLLLENESENLETKIKPVKYSESFESFWALYRMKRGSGKHEAFKAYQKAVKDIDALELLETLKRHLRFWDFKRVETTFIPHASTWLNQKRYLDELDPCLDVGKHLGQYSDEISSF